MDRDLVDRAKFGDRAAFEALVEPALPTLRGIVRRFIGDPDDTDDLVQDALLRAYEKVGSVVLRDIFEYSNREAADILDLTESVLRHKLSAARAGMQERFDGLCGIVSKTGVCYQCEGLRDRVPPERQGPTVPTLGDSDSPRKERYRLRLRVVRDADIDTGTTQLFHDTVWRGMSVVEG